MKIKKCTCGGDALVFRKKTLKPVKYKYLKRHHGEKEAELENKRLTYFWAECLSCGARSKEGNEFEYAVKNWNEANLERKRKS